MNNQIINLYSKSQELKINQIVYLIDGSGLTENKNNEKRYIVFSYPHVHPILPLKFLPFKITKINLKDQAIIGYAQAYIRAYVQDIEIEYNGVKFRTNSTFVKPKEREIDIPESKFREKNILIETNPFDDGEYGTYLILFPEENETAMKYLIKGYKVVEVHNPYGLNSKTVENLIIDNFPPSFEDSETRIGYYIVQKFN